MKNTTYDPKQFEQKWIEKWEKDGIYKTPAGATKDNKMYILPQLPYPSGSGLHVGHSSVYIPCDIYARFKRMTGKKVLQVMGWDSFGLPAENYAIKTNIHPKINTEKAIDNFRYQIKKIGISVDWDREVGSHRPDYYKFTQWFFLLMYERGLAYRKYQQVNWCDSCKTVLANDQVRDGNCERCDSEVVQKQMEQWFFKITDYADRLYEDLDKVDWPEESIKRQRNWIGKKKGVNIKFKVKDTDKELTCFTTRIDTIFGVTFVVVAPEKFEEMGLVKKVDDNRQKDIENYIKQAKAKTDMERQVEEKDKTGVNTGMFAVNPVNGEEIPVFIADYVLAGYGTGSVMGVPAHDERDFEFAEKHGLEIKAVIDPVFADKNNQEVDTEARQKVLAGELCSSVYGKLINSGEFDGITSEEAQKKIPVFFKDVMEETTTYRLRDWSVSRQRFWGAPIPMLYDEKGGLHPVPKEDLPVMLPDDVDFKPTGQSPLTYSKKFQEGVEKKYGQGWHREVDTLDTFMCSSWYYYRYLDPKNDKEFASKEALEKWMPVDFYLGGPEHVTGHLLYSRFFTKVLYDAGYISFDEPFAVHRHQGMVWGEDNRKMSKRWGNVINPIDEIEKFGADTLRIYQMFMGPVEEDKAWNTKAERGVNKFLKKAWNLQEKVEAGYESEAQEKIINKTIKKVGEDIEKLSLNTSIAKFMELVNFLQKENKISAGVWKRFILILAPFAPFITEEMWQNAGEKYSVHMQKWPEYDPEMVKDEVITIVVQVNGKLRGEMEVEADKTGKDNQAEIIKQAKELETVQKWIEGKQIKKEIYVPGKLVSLVV